MHRYIFACVVIFFTLGAMAQSASKKSKVLKEVLSPSVSLLNSSDYKILESDWAEATQANPSDDQAWLNYYKAARFARVSKETRKTSEKSKQELDALVAEMGNYVGKSYGFYFAAYLNEPSGEKKYAYLKQAAAIKGQSAELIPHLMAASLVENRDDETRQLAKLSENLGLYSSNQKAYAANVLKSLPDQAVLLTNGANDTYPILLQQFNKHQGLKKQVFNVDLMVEERYRAQFIKALKLDKTPKWKGDVYKWLSAITDNMVKEDNSNLHFALTLPSFFLQENQKRLYLTGLAFRVAGDENDLAAVEKNWAAFDLNHLNNTADFNKNYLPVLRLMKRYYTYTQDLVELNAVNEKLRLLE